MLASTTSEPVACHLLGRHRLDGTVRAHRHEGGGVDGTVRGREQAGAGLATEVACRSKSKLTARG